MIFNRTFITIFFLLMLAASAFTQNCDTKYMSIRYDMDAFEKFTQIKFTSTNEIICTGNIPGDYNGAGHLARFTKNGIPLSSNYYSIDFFSLFYPMVFMSDVNFNDFIQIDDGGVVVAGTVLRFYTDPNTQFKKYLAILAKIDKYGAVEWTKAYLSSRGIPHLSFNSICKGTDGDIIAYMSIDYGPSLLVTDYSYSRVMRFSPKGEIKWSTHLATGNHDAGGRGVFFKRALTQLSDKNIVIGDAVFKSERGTGRFRMSDGRLHFTSLDYNTGKVIWESSYPYAIPPSDSTFVPDVFRAYELPGGNLSFTAELYTTGSLSIKKPVSIITNNRGIVQKMIAYSSSSGSTLKLLDVVKRENGDIDALFRDGAHTIVSKLDANGTIISNRGYSSSLPGSCFAAGERGYAIIVNNGQSKKFNVLLSDADGHVDCLDQTVNLLSESIPVQNDNPAAVSTFIDVITATSFRNYFSDSGFPLKNRDQYPLERNIECEQPINCCVDIIDSLNARNLSLCEGTSYSLPDNSIVKNAGSYYVVYKTSRGCDSVIYYNIKFDKDVKNFSIGQDTCLVNQPSLVLRATPGYDNYSWMGSSSSLDTFRIYAPGVYTATVTNSCGRKTASVGIYDQCDFPVYMPDAFTPNGDGLNDQFGIPPQNNNRLISLKVYDRWGQLVFGTTKKDKQWDGRYKNKPLTTGLFVYTLVMEGLSGSRIQRNGKILLIR